jgi:transposase
VLLEQLDAVKALLADKAYDADNRVIEKLKANRLKKRPFDRVLYRARHLIENFFAKLKQFRGIATRYDKTARNFLGGIYLVALCRGQKS